jgi:hypothetical protein
MQKGIPEHPVEGFILGLTKGSKALSVESFYLQRSEQHLAACVVPAADLCSWKVAF